MSGGEQLRREGLETPSSAGHFRLERRPIPCPAGCGREGALMVIGRSEIPALCPTCQASVDEATAEQERRHRVEVLLDRAGGSARMRAWSLGTYPADTEARSKALRKAIEWRDAWLAGERVNVFVDGRVGVGKTGLAWAIVRDLCEREHEALFVNFRELLHDLRASFDDRGRPADYLRASSVPVLVVDDVGAERPTDFAREELASLVERRYQARRATWFTSNYGIVDLGRRLGHDDPVLGMRIVSRMVHEAVQIGLEGTDMRASS